MFLTHNSAKLHYRRHALIAIQVVALDVMYLITCKSTLYMHLNMMMFKYVFTFKTI